MGSHAGSQEGQRREEESGRWPEQSLPTAEAQVSSSLKGSSHQTPRLSRWPNRGHQWKQGPQPLSTLRTEPRMLTFVWGNHSTLCIQVCGMHSMRSSRNFLALPASDDWAPFKNASKPARCPQGLSYQVQLSEGNT